MATVGDSKMTVNLVEARSWEEKRTSMIQIKFHFPFNRKGNFPFSNNGPCRVSQDEISTRQNSCAPKNKT